LNSHVEYADIFDGSSKTLLAADMLPTEPTLSWLSGTRATLRNTSSISSGNYRERALELKPNEVGGFGSFHSGSVINALFADGSIQVVSSDIDPEIFRLFGHRADGELIMDDRW
jgi:prepilin-type processing-associated H-X9-DG protein